MKVNYIAYSFVWLSVPLLMAAGTAFGDDAKVVIVNGTSNHCLPYPSCYKPFQVNISPGDTVTWINDDNRTHTVTTGTSNYGPKGFFDSGPILPGHSYTQFIGITGKFQYYDKVDWWPSGVIFVSRGIPSHAELEWVNGTLSLTKDNNTEGVVITKQLQNTDSSDANSIILRLKIRNATTFVFYDDITTEDVLAKQNTPISFVWNNPLPGKYILNFDADAAHTAGETNENNEQSSDIISISLGNQSQYQYTILDNFTLNRETSVPEFSSLSYLVLTLSILSILVWSKPRLKIRI